MKSTNIKHLLTGIAIALPMLATAGPSLERIKQTGQIILAHRESSVPFSYLDGDKKPVGYALDICYKLTEAIQKSIGAKPLTINYLMVTPSNRVPMIVDGKADMECGSTTNNPDRRQKVSFTIPHYISGARILTLADAKFNDLNDFQHHKMVSTKGTTALKQLGVANKDRLLDIQIVEGADHDKSFAMVGAGEADGFVMDDILLYGIIAKSGSDKFKVTGKFLTVEPLAIMLPKNDPELKEIVDREMKRLIATKEIAPIYDKWFMSPIPPKNSNMRLPVNYLLRDFWKYPSDKVDAF